MHFRIDPLLNHGVQQMKVLTIAAQLAALSIALGIIASVAPTPKPYVNTPTVTETATDRARASLAFSLRNLEIYCGDNVVSHTVRNDIDLYIKKYRLREHADATAYTLALGRDYADGFGKYGNLWCANTASMAKAISESVNEWSTQ
jgi:hypothetical protein